MSKIEQFWQDATAKDVARVMAGETVEARFRDSETRNWSVHSCKLKGWTEGSWACNEGLGWVDCQVYREPSWYANKPDPGPGYRLLEKFPDEELKPGDEYFDRPTGRWHLSGHAKTQQQQLTETWYRRRIAPVEPKFAVGQMARVVGPKVKPAKDWGKEMDRQIGFVGVIRSIPILEGEGTFYNLEGIGIWCFREDYLEPVEPEPKHYVLRVGDSVETPRGHLINVVSSHAEQRIYSLDAGDKLTLPSGQTIMITAKGFEVTQ